MGIKMQKKRAIKNDSRSDVINNYANSMFRSEYLHEKWLKKCQSYLCSIFGRSLEGKVVLDYAFGRGNWSVAFSRLGVERVISVDASVDNVERFKEYCKNARIKHVEVIHGNIMEENLKYDVDIFWIYGILQHIQSPNRFLYKLSKLARNKDAKWLIYHYDASSMRQFVVDACRKIVSYSRESDFTKDSYLFVPSARMRARDDLTAPIVNFKSLDSLEKMLHKSNLRIIKTCSSFQEFQTGILSEEFAPHHLMCEFGTETTIHKEIRPYSKDMQILNEMVDYIWSLRLPLTELKRIAIGLYNTHFSHQYSMQDVRPIILSDFLFLYYVLRSKDADTGAFSSLTRKCLQKAKKSLQGKNTPSTIRKGGAFLNESFLTNYLDNNNIRI